LRFSEGARQLWGVIFDRQLGLNELARVIRRASDPIGDVPRWIYGDKIPPLWALARIEELFGIPPALWLKKPRRTFVPPARRAA
jgi:hypothetical protein